MRFLKRARGEAGQMLILLVGFMTLVFVVGAIVVDIGIWVNERRGAQTDADFIALTAAWELIDPGASELDALDAADEGLAANDEGNVDIANIDADLNTRCVSVDVTHESRRLFSELLGVVTDPDIGAHAKACAGAAQAPGNLVPFQIDDNPGPCFDDNEEPKFTALCPLELGAQGSNPRGMVDLEASGDYCSQATGAGDIEDLIEWGADGICLINDSGTCDPGSNGPWYDCVAIQTGNPQKVLDGVAARLAREGACDANGDGYESFAETVNVVFDTGDPFTSIYEPTDCDPLTEGNQMSVRLVSLIVLEEPPPPGNSGHPIIAFAGFYLAGCAAEGDPVDDESDVDPDCNSPGNRHFEPQSEPYVMAPQAGVLPVPNACHGGTPHGNQTCAPTPTPGPTSTPGPGPSSCGGPGHCVVYGRFVNLITSGGDIGEPNDQTTIFGIALVE